VSGWVLGPEVSRWVDGLEQEAEGRLPEAVARYFRQGSRDGIGAAEAERVWREVRIRPRTLRDVSAVTTATTLLGTRVPSPVSLAPTTLQRHAHPDGEVAMARGAAFSGSLLCVSSNAGSTFAAVSAVGAPWWVQVYVLQDRRLTESMLARAVAAGARAVVVTVDTPVVATKYDDGPSVWEGTPESFLHANLDIRLTSATDHLRLEKASDLTPDVIGWLGDTAGLPVVVKGVLRGDDAVRAVEAGASAVWVSNHGGRQLDQAVPTRWALPEVAAAVAGRAEVYVDGGIRRGLDVLTACSLGARAAFIGRPALWALSVEGAEGVARLLDELRGELVEAMTLAGCPSLDEATDDLVVAGK
jgi:4-hydroxymandelate oxidase